MKGLFFMVEITCNSKSNIFRFVVVSDSKGKEDGINRYLRKL